MQTLNDWIFIFPGYFVNCGKKTGFGWGDFPLSVLIIADDKVITLNSAVILIKSETGNENFKDSVSIFFN